MSRNAIHAVALSLTATYTAHAQSAPESSVATPDATSAELGAFRVSLESTRAGDPHLRLSHGATETRLDVRAPSFASLGLEAVDVGATDVRVLAIRVDASLSRRFVLVDVRSHPRVLATLGPFPADEEHGATLVTRRSPGTSEPVIGVSVAVTDPCGTHVRVVAPFVPGTNGASGRSLGSVLVEDPPSSTLIARPTASDAPRPSLSTLVFDTAVTSRGPTSSGLEALADADPNTRFPADPNEPFGEIHLRFPFSPLRLTALVIDPVAGPGGGRELLLRVGDVVRRIEVDAPTGPVTVAFDAPIDARCMELSATGTPASARAIGTIYAVPEADGDAAVSRLVTELADDGGRADLAAEALARIGAPALATLETTFGEATTPERLRILAAARTMVAREPNALRLFVLGLESDDDAVAAMALDRCLTMGTPGYRAIAVAIRRGRFDLARALAERSPTQAIPVLLERLAATSDLAETTALREALVVAARREPMAGRDALRAFVVGDAPRDVRVCALAAMTSLGDVDGITPALEALLAAEGPDETVATRLRLLEAAERVPADRRSERVRALVRSALESDVWMLRERAVRVLATDPTAAPDLRARLEDAYPRVRAAAIEALASDEAARRRIGELSRRDEWPIVRLAALLAIAEIPAAEPLLRDAMTDRSSRVRIGILDHLGRRGDRRFASDAIGIVVRDRAPAAVAVAAIAYLERLCAREAADALTDAVDRALGQAGERELAIGQSAAHALERFGDEADVRSARRLADPTRAGMRQPERCVPPSADATARDR